MDKGTVVFIIFLILALLAFSIYLTYEYGLKDENDSGQADEDNEINSDTENPESEINLGDSSGGGSLGGSGSSGFEGPGNAINLPDDLKTRPCGYYFGDYGACAGFCPSGTCQQQGNSCYCRI